MTVCSPQICIWVVCIFKDWNATSFSDEEFILTFLSHCVFANHQLVVCIEFSIITPAPKLKYDYNYFSYLKVEVELWGRKHKEGCLDKLTYKKNSNPFNSEHVGRLWGYLYRELMTTSLNWLETFIFSGKLNIPALIFLYVYLTSLDSNGGRPKARV